MDPGHIGIPPRLLVSPEVCRGGRMDLVWGDGQAPTFTPPEITRMGFTGSPRVFRATSTPEPCSPWSRTISPPIVQVPTRASRCSRVGLIRGTECMRSLLFFLHSPFIRPMARRLDQGEPSICSGNPVSRQSGFQRRDPVIRGDRKAKGIPGCAVSLLELSGSVRPR